MSRQERIIEIDGVSYIKLSDAAKRLGLSNKKTIELMTNQGLLPEAVTTERRLSLQTRLSRKTPLLVEEKEVDNLVRMFSGN